MRTLTPETPAWHLAFTAGVVLGASCAAACGVAVEDQTPHTLLRTASGFYELTARIERASSLTAIVGVEAVTPYGTFTMMPGADPLEWVTDLPLNQCVNGFDVQFVVDWQALLAANTAREPAFGVHQKWLEGTPPAVCNSPIGQLYAVTSTSDLPDDSPGDGLCRAGREATCTLRAAVMESNAHPGQDRIELPSGMYALTRSGNDDSAVVGDLDITDDVTIAGQSAVIFSSGLEDRILDVSPTGDLVDLQLHGVTIRDGTSQVGGGINNRGRLHLFNTSIRNNAAQLGGGLDNDDGFVEMITSEVRDNEATVEFGPAHRGGGLSSIGARSFVVVRGSSFVGNLSGQHGGAIFASEGQLRMRDSTISGNKAFVHGGGVFLDPPFAGARFRNVTITENHSDFDDSGAGDGGGLLHSSTAVVTVANSIIAANFKGKLGPVPNDCWGNVQSAGGNLFGAADNCVGIDPDDLAGSLSDPLDPKLETLVSIGGTSSHRPMASSPALDAANSEEANDARTARCTHVDQRGEMRPKGPLIDGRRRCDIGAVER
jgi:predicted outer membrane repeat protein